MGCQRWKLHSSILWIQSCNMGNNLHPNLGSIPKPQKRITPPKFNSSPLKMVVGRRSFPIGVSVTFQGRTVKLWEGNDDKQKKSDQTCRLSQSLEGHVSSHQLHQLLPFGSPSCHGVKLSVGKIQRQIPLLAKHEGNDGTEVLHV